MKKFLIATLLVAVGPVVAQAPADARASDESIRELIAVTNARELMNGAWGQIDGLMEKAMKDALGGKAVNPQQEKVMAEFRGKVVDLLRVEMSWEKLEPTYFKLYRETFSQAELDGMLAFYKSDAGKAVTAKLPRMMQSLMQDMMSMMQVMMPRLRSITDEYVKKIRAAG